MQTGDERGRERQRMVDEQLISRGIRDPRLLAAFRRVPRHRFVPAQAQADAYGDHPVPIGCGQTVSQPYVVAYMVDRLELSGKERVLEVGTGSGYQTALLAEVTAEVYSVECRPELIARTEPVLRGLGYSEVRLRLGDGTLGWPEAAPFDAIVVSAAAEQVPLALQQQLAPGGRLILPVGTVRQHLVLVTRTPDGVIREEPLLPVRFVQMQQAR